MRLLAQELNPVSERTLAGTKIRGPGVRSEESLIY